jgi:hypothetical protein
MNSPLEVPIGPRGDVGADDFQKGLDRVKRATALILRTDRETGTGFLFRNGLLLTAHHVLPSVEVCREATADFGGGARSLSPDVVFITSLELDYTVVSVGTRQRTLAPLAADALVKCGQDVFIVHHPNGGPKRISPEDNRIVHVDATFIRYRADTYEGSSGAPVCDRRWRVVAMHHEGGRLEASAIEYLNEGVRASAIDNDFKERWR